MAVLTDADIIQENSGIGNDTTNFAVTLGSGTTAGNTLLVFTYCQTGISALPTGFVNDAGGGAAAIGVYRKSEIAAGETSWTFTIPTGPTIDMAWYVAEISNIDPVEPFDVTAVNGPTSTANGGTLSTGTTAQNAGLSVIAIAAFAAVKLTGATLSWSGYTNGFDTEAADVSGSSLSTLAVARKFQEGTTGTFATTATLARSDATNNAMARVVTYRAADAPIVAPLQVFTGFEFGTHGGMGNNTPSNPLGYSLPGAGTVGTNILVGSAYARTSGYGLRIVCSTSAAYVPLDISPSVKSVATGFNVRVISGTGTVVVAMATHTGTDDFQLIYDTSATKFGVRWGAAGTPVWESGTTALNTWRWFGARWKTSSTTYHADWRIETGTDTYTDQTSPGDVAGTAGTTSQVLLGSSASQTATMEYDDAVVSKYYAAYPLSPHKVQVLVPQTTGASVSGTAANFNQFTNNGTLAAFASTNGALLDDVPPTISASADGVVQVSVAASDYMEFPMADPTVAADEVIAAVRAVFPLWGGTGTGTGTLGLRVSDGTTETTVDAGSTAYDADSLTAVSATYPLWRQKLIPAPTGGWTVAKANALVCRVGYSSDATPDMGVHALYLEVATRKAQTARQITLEDPVSATADLRVNPYSSASVSYVITNNDATRSVNFNYSIAGTPQTPVTVSPSSNQTVTVNMDAFGDISDLSLEVI